MWIYTVFVPSNNMFSQLIITNIEAVDLLKKDIS